MRSRGQESGIRGRGALGRREFLRRAGMVAAAAGLGRLPRLRAGRLDAIGIQLYTVRRELAKDVEGTLAKLAGIGFREVEFAGYPEGTEKSLRGILDRLHLRAPSGHVGTQALRTDWARTLEQAATVGQQYIVVAFVPQEERRTTDDWKRTAAAFNRAGEAAKAAGLQLCYHNHDFEFAPLDGALPYDLLLASTDPKLVQLELDLYWITKGGRDPLDYFARWPGRFPLVHVKDMDATPNRYFTDVGTGTIDFRRIFRRARQAGIKHYFYEQDETPGSPFESARVSYQYLRGLTF
jgi:sugar phosphate isomerase/epimerase